MICVQVETGVRGQRRLFEIGCHHDVGAAAGLVDKRESVSAEKEIELLGRALAVRLELKQGAANVVGRCADAARLNRVRAEDQLRVGRLPSAAHLARSQSLKSEPGLQRPGQLLRDAANLHRRIVLDGDDECADRHGASRSALIDKVPQ